EVIEYPGVPEIGLRLWQIDPPLRLNSITLGVQASGQIYPRSFGRIAAFGCRGGRFDVSIGVTEPHTVTVLRNGRVYRRLTFSFVPAGGIWKGSFPALPPRRRAPGTGLCTLELRPAGLLANVLLTFDRAA